MNNLNEIFNLFFFNKTALHIAIEKRNHEIFELLINDKRSNIFAIDIVGRR